jgi:hypothetical protein
LRGRHSRWGATKQGGAQVSAAEILPGSLIVDGNVSASTQNPPLSALLFLFRDVMGIELGRFNAVRVGRPKRLRL